MSDYFLQALAAVPGGVYETELAPTLRAAQGAVLR